MSDDELIKLDDTTTDSEDSTDKFRKVFSHPDKDEIITKLLSGESVRAIEAWLKKKYPYGKRNHVSYLTLQKFRSKYLKIEADVLKDLQRERQALRTRRHEDIRIEEIKATDSYQASLSNYVQESLIDYNGTIKDLLERCSRGIERLEALDEHKGSHLNHAAIAGYLTQIKGLVEMHHKMVEKQEKKAGDQVEKDYGVLKKQLEILKQVIREIFQETAPELQPIFIAKVKERMEQEGLNE